MNLDCSPDQYFTKKIDENGKPGCIKKQEVVLKDRTYALTFADAIAKYAWSLKKKTLGMLTARLRTLFQDS